MTNAVSPERRQAIMHELAEQNADRLKEALLGALEDGFLVFGKGKPRERLAGYLSQTLAEDIPLILDEHYLDKLAVGEAPMLRAVQMIQQREQERGPPDPMTGQPGQPPTTQEPPLLWPLLISTLPPYVFEKLASDFRTLLREADRKEMPAEPWGVQM